jgi:hypothetical protein
MTLWLVLQPQYRNHNKKKITYKNLGQCRQCLIIQHLSGPMGARLKEFFCKMKLYLVFRHRSWKVWCVKLCILTDTF